MTAFQNARLHIIIDSQLIIRVIVTIYHKMTGLIEKLVAIAAQVTQADLLARCLIARGQSLNRMQS